MMHDQKYIKS